MGCRQDHKRSRDLWLDIYGEGLSDSFCKSEARKSACACIHLSFIS